MIKSLQKYHSCLGKHCISSMLVTATCSKVPNTQHPLQKALNQSSSNLKQVNENIVFIFFNFKHKYHCLKMKITENKRNIKVY